MMRTVLYSMFAALALSLSMGCTNSESIGRGDPDDVPARNANELIVTTAAGARLTGHAVRVEITRPDPDKPPADIELVVSADDGTGKVVGIQAATDLQFLDSGTLNAVLRGEGGSLQPGQARLLFGHRNATTPPRIAEKGSLEVSLVDGQLRGEVTGAGPDFDLHFAGPVLLICSTLIPDQNPFVPLDPGLGPVLTDDLDFETPACSPYASWGR